MAVLNQLHGIVARDFADGVPATPGDVVITTNRECPPETCSELVLSGLQVIVLAAVPRETERVRYAAAGADCYLPMHVDLLRLARALGTDAVERPARASAVVASEGYSGLRGNGS